MALYPQSQVLKFRSALDYVRVDVRPMRIRNVLAIRPFVG
jgi:hypothetical protein